jgi:succinoglycan biosynthesis protein ExoA
MTIHNVAFQHSKVPVLVVIPCLNEEEHIEHVIRKLAVEADQIDLTIVVADGGSNDQTRTIVQQLSVHHPVVLMDNPRRIQSTGINDAVRKYGNQAKFLIRVDAHASYPENYCEMLLDVQARTLADSVVVAMQAEGTTCIQRAAAAAQNSILGNGGSPHRNQVRDRWVDHGHHALIKMDAFNAVGGYDESFSHNEDVELDNRLSAKGFRIFLTGEVIVTYYPRRSIVGSFKQYFNIGQGRARNFLKHRRRANLRHLVLAAIAPLLCLALLTPFSALFAIPALAWMLACLTYGSILGARLGNPCAMASGIVAMAMQAGWSFGFFNGLLPAISMVGRDDGNQSSRSNDPRSNDTIQRPPTARKDDAKVDELIDDR